MPTADKLVRSAQPAAQRTAPAALRIDGRDNRWLKRFRAALRGESGEGGMIGIEGPHLVEEALRAGILAEALLVSTSGERHMERLRPWLTSEIQILRTSDKLFASAAETETPQGMAALVKPRVAAFDDLVRGIALIVVLVGVQDPGNVGTIVRAAEAFGATGVAASAAGKDSGTANPFSPKALRASAGSALRFPILRAAAAPILLAQLHVAGVETFAAVPENSRAAGAIRPWEADLRKPAALLIGNEGAGLPPEIERSAGVRVKIPLAAGVESLNAAMAATVLLYEAARQRSEE
jgi:TrmH family RNA methyltransferase